GPRGRRCETGVLHCPPEPLRPLAALDGLVGRGVDVVAEHALDAAPDLRADRAVVALCAAGVAPWRSIVRRHRHPSPRATMPRRISRVPPRSENDGAARVT